MEITSKGQVTIPKVFRDKFGLFPHTSVQFVEGKGGLLIKKARPGKTKTSTRAAAIRNMVGKGSRPMTTDEIMALTRGE